MKNVECYTSTVNLLPLLHLFLVYRSRRRINDQGMCFYCYLSVEQCTYSAIGKSYFSWGGEL